MIKLPAANPCVSCPYRRDVPSGVWAMEEYEKLRRYDLETPEQPPRVFLCHQNDGAMCCGWVCTHDMHENLGLRLAAVMGMLSPGDMDAVLDHKTSVPLFTSGNEAADHGLAEIENPGPAADKFISKLSQALEARDDGHVRTKARRRTC